MASDSFVPDNKFGIISSTTIPMEDIENFFEDGEDDVKLITRKKEDKPAEEKKEEKKETPVKGQEEEKKEFVAPKVLSIEDLEGDESEEEEKEEKEEEAQEETNTNVFGSLADDLYTLGVFKEDEEDGRAAVNTQEEFLELFRLETRKEAGDVIDKFLNSKGEEARTIFEAILVDGIDPKTYLEKFATIKDISDIDLTNEGNQEKVVRELYRRQGREGVDAKIEKLKQYGDLADEAAEAKQIIVKQDETSIENDRKAAKDRDFRKAQARQDFVQNVGRILTDKITKKEFDGIPVTRPFAEEINGYITKEVYETSKGEKLTVFDKDMLDLNKPENYEMKIKMAMLFKILQKDPTLSTIQKSGVSKESSKLFQNLQRTSKITNNTNKNTQKETPKQSWFS